MKIIIRDYSNDTLEEAMLDYAFSIRNKLLVYGSYSAQRREIFVPNLVKVYRED